MSNWLADPVACAVRLKTERGCAVLWGRGQAMARTAKVKRTETRRGSLYEHGPLFVRTEGKPGQQRTMYAGVNRTGHHAIELAALSPIEAEAMSDLLRAAYANSGGEHCAGKSLYEMIWDEMMVVTDRLMTDSAAEDDVGAARAIAYILAIIQNPYRPNVEAVREQVMERWEEENPDA